MNLLKKLISPWKAWTSFLFIGSDNVWMDDTLFGSKTTPSLEIIWPSNLPSVIANRDLFGFKDIPNFLHLSKTFIKCFKCFLLELDKKNFFLEIWLSPLSSFLQGTPRGSVVIIIMRLGVISMERPLTKAVAWAPVRGMRERANSQATSSSYPLNFSK